MKLGIIAFSLLTASSAFASNHENILKQVDALVAKDTYENAFHCQDQATTKDNTCWDGQCSDFINHSEVTSCGALTTILQSAEGDDETSELQLDKATYQKFKGNPLRLFGDAKKFRDSGVEWTGVQSLKVDYLGAKRNALKVMGTIEMCTEEEEVPGQENKSEECFRGPLEVVIVQGVPFLAKMSALSFSLDGLVIHQNVIEFSRKE